MYAGGEGARVYKFITTIIGLTPVHRGNLYNVEYERRRRRVGSLYIIMRFQKKKIKILNWFTYRVGPIRDRMRRRIVCEVFRA